MAEGLEAQGARPEELQQALFAYHEAWGQLLGLPML